MPDAYVGLGANLGDRERSLWSAAWSIALPIEAASSLYRSQPMETEDRQPDYLNAVVRLRCPNDMEPRGLLARLLEVEARHGRVRRGRHAARTLDLDLLYFGQERSAGPALLLPHPGIARRRFVLQPLREVLPDGRLPLGGDIEAWLRATMDQDVSRVCGGGWLWRMRK